MLSIIHYARTLNFFLIHVVESYPILCVPFAKDIYTSEMDFPNLLGYIWGCYGHLTPYGNAKLILR